MIDFFIAELIRRKIKVKPFNLARADLGELAISLVDAATLVVASPTVLTGLHPVAVQLLYLVNALRPKVKFISFIASYGWGGRAVEHLREILSSIDAEFIDPVIIKGYPKREDFESPERLARNINRKHQDIGILKDEKG